MVRDLFDRTDQPKLPSESINPVIQRICEKVQNNYTVPNKFLGIRALNMRKHIYKKGYATSEDLKQLEKIEVAL